MKNKSLSRVDDSYECLLIWCPHCWRLLLKKKKILSTRTSYLKVCFRQWVIITTIALIVSNVDLSASTIPRSASVAWREAAPAALISISHNHQRWCWVKFFRFLLWPTITSPIGFWTTVLKPWDWHDGCHHLEKISWFVLGTQDILNRKRTYLPTYLTPKGTIMQCLGRLETNNWDHELFTEVISQVWSKLIFSYAYISEIFLKPVDLPPAGHFSYILPLLAERWDTVSSLPITAAQTLSPNDSHQRKMAVLVSEMWWLHFCTHATSSFTYVKGKTWIKYLTNSNYDLCGEENLNKCEPLAPLKNLDN